MSGNGTTKRAIPSARGSQEDFNRAVKESLEIITGQRVPKIQRLQPDASNAQVIAKINEIIDRLQ